jgi:hypothetical protein
VLQIKCSDKKLARRGLKFETFETQRLKSIAAVDLPRAMHRRIQDFG